MSDAFLDQLVEVGFDPVYGARPLKRAIQQQLENPLAQKLLAGDFLPGQKITAGIANDLAVFSAEMSDAA